MAKEDLELKAEPDQPAGGGGGAIDPQLLKHFNGKLPPGATITTGENVDEGSDLPKGLS